MRTKISAAACEERGGGLTNPAQAPSKSRAAVVEIIAHATVVNGNDLPAHDRVLIDRFGHLHTTNVLKIWPDKVRAAMGLRFVDRSELMEAGHARPS